ncbi:MAG: ribosome silencing factor [Deltaproteobacteria bacterium]|nr:ribosome silencing factor [Deltaproteobacteria bacterium]
MANAIATAALEKKAQDLVLLDMKNLVSYTDIFVLCSATNPRQAKAIADYVVLWTKREFDRRPKGVEGITLGKWVLVDFGDVVLHIFDGPLRGFYNLDGLWADAPRLPVPEAEELASAGTHSRT